MFKYRAIVHHTFGLLLITLGITLLVGCTTTKINTTPFPIVDPYARWGIMPFNNNTEVPLAERRAMTITAELLRASSIEDLLVFHPPVSKKATLSLTDPATLRRQALSWARSHQVRYLVMGSVNEWRYKVGLDGEPVAGVTIKVMDTMTEEIIWSAVGSKSGGSRVSLSTVGQALISQMLAGLYARSN